MGTKGHMEALTGRSENQNVRSSSRRSDSCESMIWLRLLVSIDNHPSVRRKLCFSFILFEMFGKSFRGLAASVDWFLEVGSTVIDLWAWWFFLAWSQYDFDQTAPKTWQGSNGRSSSWFFCKHILQTMFLSIFEPWIGDYQWACGLILRQYVHTRDGWMDRWWMHRLG